MTTRSKLLNFLLVSERPDFSVVIATYDRGEKIHATLQSVANQTHKNFEVLIVSDGPASPSLRKTVRKFGKKFRLLELSERTGSQSGPNNMGREFAKGNFISYLGHDDIWHPNHLKAVQSVAVEFSEADFIVSGCLFLGPLGMTDELTWISGLFSDFGVQAGLDHFFPPSSVTHKNYSLDILPPWQDAFSISAPVDSAFMKSAAQRGLTFFSTQEITVFKLASALRYLSYLLPSDEEQNELLRLISNKKALQEFVEEKKLLSIKQGTFMHLTHPDETQFSPGEITKRYAKVRGIAAEACEEIFTTTLILMTNQNYGFDWHQLEEDAHGSWRWSGPSNRPRLALLYTCEAPVAIVLNIKDFLTNEIRDSLKLLINDVPAPFVLEFDYNLGWWKLSTVTNLTREKGSVLELQMGHATSPNELNGESQDSRKLGLGLTSIEISPVSKI